MYRRRQHRLFALRENLHRNLAVNLEVARWDLASRPEKRRAPAFPDLLNRRPNSAVHRSKKCVVVVPVESNNKCTIGLLAKAQANTGSGLGRGFRSQIQGCPPNQITIPAAHETLRLLRTRPDGERKVPALH
jgi:hypothetical protein